MLANWNGMSSMHKSHLSPGCHHVCGGMQIRVTCLLVVSMFVEECTRVTCLLVVSMFVEECIRLNRLMLAYRNGMSLMHKSHVSPGCKHVCGGISHYQCIIWHRGIVGTAWLRLGILHHVWGKEGECCVTWWGKEWHVLMIKKRNAVANDWCDWNILDDRWTLLSIHA
jgi:hypothetical protein